MTQTLQAFDGLFLTLLFFIPLLSLQHWLHREIQSIFLLLTRRVEMSYVIFSVLFLPGVFLHEISHFLMARLLRVRTGGFSLLPKPLENGRLQLGYVETSPTDLVRDALIGMAPLLVGGAFVAYAGINRLELHQLWNSLSESNLLELWDGFIRIGQIPDFWIWFYLAFAVSSTMLPSASDRKAWLPLTLIGVVLTILILLAGAGPWLMANLAPILNEALRTVAVVFAISTAIHLVLVLPAWGVRKSLSYVFGLKVV
jgi:hypothetical protein